MDPFKYFYRVIILILLIVWKNRFRPVCVCDSIVASKTESIPSERTALSISNRQNCMIRDRFCPFTTLKAIHVLRWFLLLSHEPRKFSFLCELLSRLFSFHLLNLGKHIVSNFWTAVIGHISRLPHEQIFNLHQPNFPELILVEIHFHPEYLKTMGPLQIETHYVAHFQAVLKRCFFFQLLIIRAELLEVVMYLPIVRHRFIFYRLFLWFDFSCLKAWCYELERE